MAALINNAGLVGAGTMGEPMGHALLRAGFSLHVWAHRKRDSVERLVAAGAHEHANLKDLAAASDAVVTMVPDAPQVEEALFGRHGVAAGLRPGSLVIDMSTISPLASRAFHERLRNSGIAMLDAPVSGGPSRAASGELTIMAGGDSDAFAQAQPLFAAMGSATLVGGDGMGETFKLANQLIIANIMLANIEALVFARKAGADIELLCRVLSKATASNYLLEKWLPAAWFENGHRGGFALDLLRKDLRAALEAAQAAHVPTPSSAQAAKQYDAASAQGWGRDDYSAVARIYELAAGISVTAKRDEPESQGSDRR